MILLPYFFINETTKSWVLFQKPKSKENYLFPREIIYYKKIWYFLLSIYFFSFHIIQFNNNPLNYIYYYNRVCFFLPTFPYFISIKSYMNWHTVHPYKVYYDLTTNIAFTKNQLSPGYSRLSLCPISSKNSATFTCSVLYLNWASSPGFGSYVNN